MCAVMHTTLTAKHVVSYFRPGSLERHVACQAAINVERSHGVGELGG
jgi:hypothetical protein